VSTVVTRVYIHSLMLHPAGDHAKSIHIYYYGCRSVFVQHLCRADPVTDSFIDCRGRKWGST